MARFEGADDPGFVAVAGELRRWARELAWPGTTRAVDETSGQGIDQAGGDTQGSNRFRIYQGGSEFHGATTVSGGSTFQGNFIG
jgi:hypothetical protein